MVERFLVETEDGGLFIIEATPDGFKVIDLHPSNLGKMLGAAFPSDTDDDVFMLQFENQPGLVESRRIGN